MSRMEDLVFVGGATSGPISSGRGYPKKVKRAARNMRCECGVYGLRLRGLADNGRTFGVLGQCEGCGAQRGFEVAK